MENRINFDNEYMRFITRIISVYDDDIDDRKLNFIIKNYFGFYYLNITRDDYFKFRRLLLDGFKILKTITNNRFIVKDMDMITKCIHVIVVELKDIDIWDEKGELIFPDE